MTKEQVQLLKQFTAINTAFSISGSEDIAVLAADKSIMSFYTPKEGEFTEFTSKTRIHNVDYLMALIDTIGIDSTISVTAGTSVNIKNGNKSVKFLQASEGTVPDVPTAIEDKFAALPVDIEFTLNKTDIEQLKKISSLLSLSDVKITAAKKKVQISLGASDVASSNNYNVTIDGKGDAEITVDIVKFGKMISDDYIVKASTKGLVQLTAVNVTGLRYYMATLAR